MARPTKQGIDYFPLDCQFDDKVEMYLLEKGAVGFAVLISIWQMIYSNEGYYISDNNDLRLLIRRKIDVGINETNECIDACLRRNLFDHGMQDEHKILTSRAIQQRYFDAAKKKRSVTVNEEFLLISTDFYKNLVNSDGNPVNSDGNPVNSDGNSTESTLDGDGNARETEPVGDGNATNVNVKVNVKEEVKVKENIKHTQGQLSHGRQPIPPDFKPDEATLEYCRFKNLPEVNADLIGIFIHSNKSSGWASADWQSEFKNWLHKKKVWFDENKARAKNRGRNKQSGGESKGFMQLLREAGANC